MYIISFSSVQNQYPGLSIATLIMIFVAAVMMRVTGRVVHVHKYLIHFDFLKKNPKVLKLCTLLYWTMLVSPLVMLIALCALLMNSFGINPGLPVLLYGLFALLAILPSEDVYFYARMGMMIVLFLSGQLVTLFSSSSYAESSYRYTFFALSQIFLLLNGAFVCIALWLIDGKEWNLDLSIGFIIDDFVRLCPSWKIKDKPMLLSGGIYSMLINAVHKKWIIAGLFLCSWIILIVYALIIVYTTNLQILGPLTSIVVVSTDVFVLMLLKITEKGLVNPNRISAFVMFIRICLFGFTAQYWFLGYCLLYLIFTAYTSLLIIDRRYPNFQKTPTLELKNVDLTSLPETVCFVCTLMFSAIIYYISQQSQLSIPILSITLGTTVYPFWAIGVGSMILSVAVFFYMTTLRILTRKVNRIRQFEKFHFLCKPCGQYYIFLFASYVMIVIFGCYFYVNVGNSIILFTCVFIPLIYQSFIEFYRSWQQNDFLILGDVKQFNRKIKRALETKDKIQQKQKEVMDKLKNDSKLMNQSITKKFVKQTIKVAPINSSNSLALNQNSRIKGRDEDSEMELFVQEIKMQGDHIQLAEDWTEHYTFWQALKKGKLLRSDKRILTAFPIMVLMLIAFSISCYFGSNPRDTTAFTICVEFLYILLTFLPLKRYFSTLQRLEVAQIISFIVGILLNFLYGGFMLVNTQNRQTWVIWWAFVNPIILVFYTVWGLTRDYGVYFGSIFSGVILIVSGFGLGIYLIISVNLISGIAAIAVFVFVGYFLGSYFYYLKNNRAMPNAYYVVTSIIIVLTSIAVAIVLYFVYNYDGFVVFSIVYIIVVLLLGSYASYLVISDLQTHVEAPNFYSSYGLVFKYSAKVNSSVLNMWPITTFYTFLVLILFYALLLHVFVFPCQIGVAATCLFTVPVFYFFVFFQTFNSYTAGKYSDKITERVVTEAWTEQKQVQLLLKTVDQNQASLDKKYQEQLESYQAQFEKTSDLDIGHKLDLFESIVDLEEKIEKQRDEQLAVGVNLWMRIVRKVQSIEKQKWLKYIGFINNQNEILTSFGIIIVVDKVLDTEGQYLQIMRDYSLLTAEQKLKFDYYMAIYLKQRAELQVKLQELQKQQQQLKRIREQNLLKRLQQDQDNFDENLPVEKMRDSPKKLQKIIASLKPGQKFTDPSFKADNSILPKAIIPLCKGFKRPQNKVLISKEGQTFMNVRQGQLGDCYLISSIGVLTRKYICEMLGVGKWTNPDGGYMVKITKMNRNLYIIVDDILPLDLDGELLFGKCENPSEIYVSIIEKAYAKLNGGYMNIVGGKVNLTLSQFTGGFPEEVALAKYQQQNTNDLYDRMLKYHQQGYLLGAGSPENVNGDSAVIDGVVQGHAYQIVNVKNIDGNRLIKLRNPHGNGSTEWKGDWADGSQKWTQRLLNLLGEEVKSDDGAFWMVIDDFVYCYKSLYICRIFEEKIWKKQIFSGEWKGKTAGGLPSQKNPTAKMYNNPHYGIKVTKKSTLFIELQQKQMSGNWKGKNFIYFLAQKNGGKRITTNSVEKLCGKADAVLNTASISGQISLDAPSYPYVFSLMLACINPGDEGTYNLITYCDDMSVKIIQNNDFDV